MAWHERYAARGLRVVAAHAPSGDAGRDDEHVTDAVAALAIPFEVILDTEFALWQAYENPGWPARYVLASGMRLVDVHFGEGGYAEAERAIQDLIGSGEDLLAPVRAIDVPDAMIVAPSADQDGVYCGPYEAGEVWVDAASTGTLAVNGVDLMIDRIGAHQVVANDAHVAAEIDLRPAPGLVITRTLFGPGVVAAQPGSTEGRG